MKTARSGVALEVELGLERGELAAERVARTRDVEQSEVVAVEHDQPGAGAEHGRAAA